MRHSIPAFTLVLCVALTAADLPAAPLPGYVQTVVVDGLAAPAGIAFIPDDDRMLIIEKGGALKLFDPDGGGPGVATTDVVHTFTVCNIGESGLLGIALHPDFDDNGFVYLYMTVPDAGNLANCNSGATRKHVAIRVTIDLDTPELTDGDTPTVIVDDLNAPQFNHAGGGLRIFGPPGDEKLHVNVGDGGTGDNRGCPGSAQNPFAQDLNALGGKILRVNLDGSTPADNPFVGQAGADDRVFAYGFRNPFRGNVDPQTGLYWVGDVGDAGYEEIDRVVAGGNYGFPLCEGPRPQNCEQGLSDYQAPVFAYPHGRNCNSAKGSLGRSVTGGDFAGEAFDTREGDYIFGDFSSSSLYLAEMNDARTGFVGTPRRIVSDAAGPVDIVTGPDGALYYSAFFTGEVRRLSAVSSPSGQQVSGAKLSLQDPNNATKKSISVTSKAGSINLGAGNGSIDDPTIEGGTLRVVTTDGCGGPCDHTYSLPSDFWSLSKGSFPTRSYKFSRSSGAIRSITLNPASSTRLKITGKGPALGHELPVNPGPVDVVLTIGGHAICMQFGGTVKYKTSSSKHSFTASGAPAPADCSTP